MMVACLSMWMPQDVYSHCDPSGEAQALEVLLGVSAVGLVTAGKPLQVPVTMRNKGTGRAFWLQLISDDEATARPWVLEAPPVVPLLEPGATTTLTARVHLYPARTNPKSVETEIRLLVLQAYGDPTRAPPIKRRYDFEPMYDSQDHGDLPVIPPAAPWLLYGAALAAMLALAGWVYYQRVYRDPTVVRISNDPATLLMLEPENLGIARKRLARAGQLDEVLRAARVHEAWLDRAVQWDKLKTAKERCALLADRLGRHYDGPAADPALWTIDLGEDFPLNLQRLRLCLPPADSTAQDVLNRIGTPPEVTLVLGADPEQRRALASEAPKRGGLLVAPPSKDLTALLLAENPVEELARLIARHVPVTQVSPYQLGGGLHKHSLFFGRGTLIAQITGGDPANYLVVGGRQVGKSSLLKAIERHYRNDSRVDCHSLVLSGEEATARLAEALGLPPGTDFDATLEHLHKPRDGRVVLLIDEADSFVHADRKKGYATLQKLRAVSEEGRAQFILAGFWSLYKQAALDYQSPLKNFGRVLTVGALEEEACRALAIKPMEQMGIRWESQELLTKLITETGRRANLISIACDAALHALGQTERTIAHEHLLKAFADTRLRDALLGWGDLGEDEIESRRDRIVVYATALEL